MEWIKIIGFVVDVLIIGVCGFFILKVIGSRNEAIKRLYYREVTDELAYELDGMLPDSLIREGGDQNVVTLPDPRHLFIKRIGSKKFPYVVGSLHRIPRKHWLKKRLDVFFEEYENSEERSKRFSNSLTRYVNEMPIEKE